MIEFLYFDFFLIIKKKCWVIGLGLLWKDGGKDGGKERLKQSSMFEKEQGKLDYMAQLGIEPQSL